MNLYSYEAFRKHLHDDERPVERATLQLLDMGKIQDYMEKMRVDRPGFSRLTQEQTMEMLNVTRNGIPTLAAVLNFCLYPQGFFPQLGITAIVVPGTEIGDVDQDSARFIDNKRIGGIHPRNGGRSVKFLSSEHESQNHHQQRNRSSHR